MLSFIKGFSSGIQSKYSIGQESFKVGPWTVHDGKVRSSGEPVSVFVFDKSSFTKTLNSGVRKSVATQHVTDYAQRGVAELVKLRHPSVVRLIEPIESSSRSMLFVTERLTSSLETLIVAKRNESLGSEELNELAIERGALVLCQGLRFLHDTGRVHTNLCPSSVFVASNGDWKIGGLEFLSEPSDDFFLPDTDPRLPAYLRLDLDFLAPEAALDHRLGIENDVWALAAILYTAYTLREPLDCRGNPNSYKEEYNKFARKLKTLPHLAPRLSSGLVNQLMERDPTQRLDIGAFEQTDYFNHSLVKALQFLDDFDTKSASDKSQFLKYLLEILPEFPKAILRRKVLQFVVKELAGPASDQSCTLQLANVLFAISSTLSQLTFTEEILPLFKSLGSNSQFQESLVENLGIVVDSTSEKNFVKEVVPILENILKDKENGTLQRSLLLATPQFVGHVTISCLEQKLFPLVLDLFGATQVKSVKLACLGSFSTMIINKLSTLIITDKLLPALQGMKTRDPAVVMAVKELYENVAEKTSINTVMEKIMPHMCELSLSRDLTIPQFKSLVDSMRKELNKFEAEQTKLLAHNREENNTFNKEALSSAPAASKDSFMSEAFKKETTKPKPSGMDFFDSEPIKPAVQPVKVQPVQPVSKPQSPTLPQPPTITSRVKPQSKPQAPVSFDDDFGSFSSTPASPTTQWQQPASIQPVQPAQPAQSNYSSPFLVSSLASQPAQPVQPTQNWGLLQPQSKNQAQSSWSSPLQPQSKSQQQQSQTPAQPAVPAQATTQTQQQQQQQQQQPAWMQPLQPTKR